MYELKLSHLGVSDSREEQTVSYELTGRQLVVKPIEDPLELAIRSKKWAKTSVREFEAGSLREQDELSA